jgi:GntR family transcriptional regulator, arabinose operon transcriptional repressor
LNEILDIVEIDGKRGKDKPIYEQIATQIKRKIESSEVVAGTRLPSISEMMKKWRIAYPTIKTALEILEDEKLIRVEPGRGKGPLILRNIRRKTKMKFAFHRWSNEVQFLNLERGMKRFVDENCIDFSVLDFAIYGPHLDLNSLVAESEGMDGLILYPMDCKEYFNVVTKIVENEVNVVFVDRTFPNFNVSSICSDNFAGGHQACEHLMEQHDIPVYFFGTTCRPSSAHLRYQGWFQAMREHFPHLSTDKSFVWEIPLLEAEADVMSPKQWEGPVFKEALEFIGTHKDEKLCVCSSNDDAARMLMDAAKEHGRKVGHDIFIVGFGDKPYCERLDTTLSSVVQSDEKIGYEAARLLNDIVNNPNLSFQRINRVIPVELKIRESSVKH